MSAHALLIVAAALIGLGVYGALSQRSFVMLIMGFELMLNGALLACMALWPLAPAYAPKGQLVAVVVMMVMALEMAVGFALVTAVYRKRQADTTEALTSLKH